MSYWFASKVKETGFDAERSPRADVERGLGLGADSLPALVMDRVVVRDILVVKKGSISKFQVAFEWRTLVGTVCK